MSESQYLREGTVDTVQVSLLSDGSPVDLSGYSYIEMRMQDAKGKAYRYCTTDSGNIIVVAQLNSGVVNFTIPNNTVFMYNRQPYDIYFKIHPNLGNSSAVYSIPEDGTAKIYVTRDY